MEAEIHSLGVIPNTIDDSFIGPGIIQLAILAQAEGKSKIFRTTKNISKFLKEAKSVVYNNEEGCYTVENNDVRIEPNFNFIITKEHIMSDTEDGIHEWDSDGNDLEGEI